MKWLSLFIRLAIGAFFMVSAYGKLMGMEAFEIYIFRSSFLSFDAASIVARLIISFEVIAALSLIFKWGYQLIWKLTMVFILLMTGFLAWQVLAGEDDNCHCLGELLSMSPTESLIKNALLIIALVVVRKDAFSYSYKYKKWVAGVLFSAALIVPFIVSPPELFIRGQYSVAEYNQELLQQAIARGDIPSRFVKGRKLISFYSMKCKYCKMSSTRISTLVQKEGIDRSQVHVVFGGMKGNPIDFYDETHSTVFEFTRLHGDTFLSITKGRMPLTLLIEDGRVVAEMNYSNIETDKIIRFLKGS